MLTCLTMISNCIPLRRVGRSGHKFFDRAEVKDIIAYLQLAENPSYTRTSRSFLNCTDTDADILNSGL